MIYTLHGHNLRHAVEEMLLHLLPEEIPSYSPAPDAMEDHLCSALSEQDGRLCATASVRLHGRVQSASHTAPADQPDALERKRRETEIVKLAVYDAITPLLEQLPEWGALTGVRPAKLARSLMARGLDRGQAARYFRERYHVSPERTVLAMRAAAFAQAAQTELGEKSVSLYIGIPFCPNRCAYCSFVSQSVEKSAGLIAPYLDALCGEITEIGRLLEQVDRPVASIYIGGGTPTTLSAQQLRRLMDCVARTCNLGQLREYTVEAGRPDTITAEKLEAIREGGADRVSINPQTMNDQILERIGRRHTADDVLRAYDLARKTGFPVINMDVIAGLEGDTAESFARTMDCLLALAPENITVHTLAIKRGADLSDKAAHLARHQIVRDMLNDAAARLTVQGYGPYYLYRQKFTAGGFENVGWCRPGTESLYNIAMMEEIQTIISAGAGGVTKRVERRTGKITRYTNPKYPKEYIDSGRRMMCGKRALLGCE